MVEAELNGGRLVYLDILPRNKSVVYLCNGVENGTSGNMADIRSWDERLVSGGL